MNPVGYISRSLLKRWFPTRSFLNNSRLYSGAYDAPGKTTTTIVNHADVSVNMIDSYSQMGFRLINGAFLHGPCIILRDKHFYWDIGGDEDIQPESLEFFFHLYPPLDLLIIGYCHKDYRVKMNKNIPLLCRKHGISVELLPAEKAVQTFNFLIEIRNVAGAFIPPREYKFSDADIILQKQRLGLPEALEHSDLPSVKLSTDNPDRS